MGNMAYGDIHPQVMALMQAAQDRQMQPATDLYWPDQNPAQTPAFKGPPVHPGGGFPGFLGPPQHQQPPDHWLGPPIQGFAQPGFGAGMPAPPAPDLYAAGRHMQKQREMNTMDPARATAIQEMGKYLQQWGKLHQHHATLKEALHGMNAPKGR